MADVEKPEQNEMTDSEQPKSEKEGGEVVDKSPEAIPAAEKVEETVPEPPSLEEEGYSDEEYQRFVEFYERTMSEIRQGEIVLGRVLGVTDQEVMVDIGFKSEGSIPIEEFGEPPEVKVGDKVEVFLDTIEDADGQLILSKKKATFMRLWDNVVEIYNEGGTIEGKCVRRIKGGIVVDLMGVDAFLPGSQIDVKPIRDFDALIGRTFEFKIVKVNRLRKNIVVSRRAILEESMAEQRKEVLATLEKNQIREGSVKNITDFGVFVDLGGVDGLLHINDLSWGRVKHPSEVVKLDEKIKVIVLDFNDAKDRISLGFKQLQPHPWQGIEEKYPEGGVVKGKVVSIADYGAFVELERGVEGLIHVSEMSWTRHKMHPSKLVSVGDEVDVKVLSVDRERKRISLGIKQLTPDPWDEIEKKYPAGTKYTGRVRNMTNFGAFVEMEEGIDGLIHISDLSWTRKIKHPSEILKKGEEIQVVVLDVNKDERRVSLGYKQLTEDPWPAFEDAYKVDTLTSGKIIRFVDKGLIIELPLGLEGFVPLSQLPESSMDKVALNMKEGDEYPFVVIEFDRTNKRVVLSRKKALEMEKESSGQADKSEIEAFVGDKEAAPTLGEMAGEDVGEVDKEIPDKAKEKKTRKKAGKDKESEKDEAKAKARDAGEDEPETGSLFEGTGKETETEAVPEPPETGSTAEADVKQKSKDDTDKTVEEPETRPEEKPDRPKKEAAKPETNDDVSGGIEEKANEGKPVKGKTSQEDVESPASEQAEEEEK